VTGPKIRFDVEANATGQAEVQGLANELERLDDAVDPAAAARAQALGAELRKLGQQQAAITAFGELKTRTEATRAELEQAQAAAQKFGREIAASGTPTRTQAGQMEKLRDAVRSAKTAVQEQTAALDQSRRGLTALGLSSTNLAAQQRIVRDSMASTAAQARVVVQAYQQQGAAAQASAAQQVRAQATVRESVSQLGQQLQGLQNIAALGIGGGVLGSLTADVARVADQYSNLGARIRLVTGEGAAFEAGLEGVFNVAKRTSSALEETATLFTRISTAGRELGLSQADALALTESINQAIQLSGGSAQSASAAITQLVQGLQSGVLRGEEFNSVMEQSPRLARALADGLGVPIGELRKLAEQGALTSQVVISALQGQQAALEREFGKLPQTVGRAIQNLSTEWTRYIGQADQAGGASARAAEVINLLADNLQEVANALLLAGQAAAAYKAADLAAVVLRQVAASRAAAVAQAAETTARAAGTAATVANTAALGANTASKAANAAAATAAAAAEARAAAAGAAGNAGLLSKVGLLARVAGGLGLAGVAVAAFGDLVVGAFRSAGTAIGEGAARLAGYRDRSAELEETERQLAESTRLAAAAVAEQAAAAQKAADATFGLSKEAKGLVGEFDQLVLKGESASAALAKVAGSFQLDSIGGIQAASAALDALARRGVIAGEQITAALGRALQGQDLAVFETRARAAFDSSEQGARRLQAALEAVDGEALRRAGTSVEELATGFSVAFNSAVNDVDALAGALERAGVEGERAGQLLAGQLDKALDAAKTEKAVAAVIDRLKLLGSQGKISGDQLATGLGAAQGKLDELRPGINSVEEAMKRLGVTSQEELKRTAADSRKAFELIRDDSTKSIDQTRQAFKRYAEDAIKANGGVISSQLALEAQMLGVELQADRTGGKIKSSFKDAADEVGRTKDRVSALRVEFNELGEVINSSAAGIIDSGAGRGLSPSRGGSGGAGGSGGSGGGAAPAATGGGASQRIADSYDASDVRVAGGFQLPVPRASGNWTFVPDQRVRGGSSVAQALLGQYITGSFLGQPGLPVQGVGIWVRTDARTRTPTPGTPFGGPAGAAQVSGGAAVVDSGAGSSSSGTGSGGSGGAARDINLNLNIGGSTVSVPIPGAAADELLRAIEAAKRNGGG
jgi:tape measure domain-containing protein